MSARRHFDLRIFEPKQVSPTFENHYMKRDILIITLWEIVGGLLLFASFWISRWGRCALAYDAPDWVFLLLFAAPIVIAVIFFGRLRTLFFLVLSYLLYHLFRIAI